MQLTMLLCFRNGKWLHQNSNGSSHSSTLPICMPPAVRRPPAEVALDELHS
jgi:hypothetical protein